MRVIPSDDFAAYRQLLKGAYAEADRASILDDYIALRWRIAHGPLVDFFASVMQDAPPERVASMEAALKEALARHAAALAAEPEIPD